MHSGALISLQPSFNRIPVEEEAEAIVVRPQRFLALPLLVFPLKELWLCEPLIHGVRNFRSISIVLVLNDGHVCVESLDVCLLALLGVDCGIEVIADGVPRTSAVSKRVPQEVGTGEVGGAAPTPEINFLVAPSLAFADLAIECDCRIASTD
jgi:hypothetical protein